MAFSYSDKNFTVVGNLCFVHIVLDGTKEFYDIPPAISDRILSGSASCIYPYSPVNKTRAASASQSIGIAVIVNGKIMLTNKGIGYLSLYFPIDSNK